MSDNYQAVVVPNTPVSRPRLVEIEQAVMTFLWDRGIVSRQRATRRAFLFFGEKGYPPGPNAPRYVHTRAEWNWPDCRLGTTVPHGLNIRRRKNGSWFGDLNQAAVLRCPLCMAVQSDVHWWKSPFDLALKQACRIGSAVLVCPGCRTSTDFNEWEITPPSAIGKLGFVFSNWPPLQNSFVRELATVASSTLRHVQWLI